MHNESFRRQAGDPTPPYTDATRGPLLIGMTAGFLAIALIFVVLRVYVRALVLKKWGLDDTLLVISFVLAVFTGTTFSICTTVGLGRHIWTVPVDVQQTGRRMTIAATLSYHITFIVIKIALLLQYRRVFAHPKFCLVCDVMLGFIAIFGIAVVVSSVAISAPTWRGDTFEFERYNQGAWWMATAAVHLVTDMIILCMPIPLLSSLNLKRAQKAALIVTFGVGFITTAISVVRMSTLTHVFTADVTWDVIPSLIWSEVELCCAVICACIPTLRPLLRSTRPTSSQYYNRQRSEASAEAKLSRKRINGEAFGSHSQQSNQGHTTFDADMEMDLEANLAPEMPPDAPQIQKGMSQGLTIVTDITPALAAGESDDGSDVFGPLDEEVATPLSPPPRSYIIPARRLSRSRSLSESTSEG
ncbi:hypothetical protein CORC01_04649 [Colletotrichum orchidophilum]|uniref:Rhodopsin domain-containing protein n=1 Tax=Colletotrichum orchidophilum TaxID=1209926 RepID=A0A1G4BFB2_9PEZI|nr:uncharacterized protein CORC01_04649 [Colletotrichum orchidophilum]OHF00003.1 hypothetical protein CORC01_04649 [Colletotrichum orchidophilum]